MNEPVRPLEVLVVRERGLHVATRTSMSHGLVERSLDVAADIAGPWVAIVAGAPLGMIARAVAARAADRDAFTRVRLAVASALGRDAAARRVDELGRALHEAASVTMVVVVLRDARLVAALSADGYGPAVVERRARGSLVAFAARTDRAASEAPRWHDDEVRRRTREVYPRTRAYGPGDARSAVSRLAWAGTEALLSIAADQLGWAILPTAIEGARGDRRALERQGFRFHSPLGDHRFRVVQIPTCWRLQRWKRWDDACRWLSIHDEKGGPRADVYYDAGLRVAFMRVAA